MTPAVSTKARPRPPRTGPVRSAHVLCEMARPVACGHCPASGPDEPCIRPGARGAEGFHLARFAEARRRGLITSEEFGAMIWSLRAFTNATVVYDDTFGTAA